MQTIHIHIKGCVQGVGFRPFLYRLAIDYGLKGWVCNSSKGVHIEVTGNENTLRKFYDDCINQAPILSKIVSHSAELKPTVDFDDFRIIESDAKEEVDLAVMPDLSICNDCLGELKNTHNRRSDYGFITCTNCGPRFSIITGLPYDRPFTSMKKFTMCENCQKEYDEPLDRRYYSQTNSCKSCGISLRLIDKSGIVVQSQSDIIDKCNLLLSNGSIVAVKGIGGYLLICDASSSKVVNELRARKNRPHKPFAVLVPDSLFKNCHLSSEAITELRSPESPIVVVPSLQISALSIALDEVAPGLDQVGVMYPYAPLLYMLSEKYKGPLIATSANQSGLPIIYQDTEEDFDELFKYADAILTHNRPIVMPQDDSVVKITPETQSRIVLRRSRGLAPNYFHQRPDLKDQVLALGAQLKSTFALTRKSNLYISQYLGNAESFENQEHFKRILGRFEKVVGSDPTTFLTDLHPNYFSNHLARELANKNEFKEIQHHEAHFTSVLEENDLFNSESKVLGVIWDGTGYGKDGQIWGGEFFEYDKGHIKRKYHLDYFPILSGDKMAIEPRLSAFSLVDEDIMILQKLFTKTEWSYYLKAKANPKVLTSSMGRVFDAVSCILGLIDRNSYEGQAGMMLEMEAAKWYMNNDWDEVDPIDYSFTNNKIDLRLTINSIVKGILNKEPIDHLAARFHETLIRIISDIAKKSKYYHMVFSGGVFQNGVLVDLLKIRLGNSFNLYFHKELSPNDENISFGQLVHYLGPSK